MRVLVLMILLSITSQLVAQIYTPVSQSHKNKPSGQKVDSIFKVQKSNDNGTDKNTAYERKGKRIILEGRLERNINASILNEDTSVTVGIEIIDDESIKIPSLTHDVSKLYLNVGYSSKTGVFKKEFLLDENFDKLFIGDSDVIEDLRLYKHVDYLVIGKLEIEYDLGSLDGSYVCLASLAVNVIDAKDMLIQRSFIIQVSANGASYIQAKNFALKKIISKYSSDYLTL